MNRLINAPVTRGIPGYWFPSKVVDDVTRIGVITSTGISHLSLLVSMVIYLRKE